MQLPEPEIPVAFGRRAHTDQGNVGCSESLLERQGCSQAAGIYCRFYDFLQSRLIERRRPIPDRCYFVLVFVDPDDSMSKVSKTGGGNAAYITKAQNGNPGIRSVRRLHLGSVWHVTPRAAGAARHQ